MKILAEMLQRQKPPAIPDVWYAPGVADVVDRSEARG
jgi:hypothetical protein